MSRQPLSMTCRASIAGLVVALAGASFADQALAQDWGRDARREDRRTCARYGAPQGSPGYARCMLQQQQRRDDAPLNAAEAQRASAEAARNNVETVRRIRCNREAKRARERGETARWCE